VQTKALNMAGKGTGDKFML